MSENNAGKLYERIAQVSKDIGSLVPDKRNTDQKYDYISADKILERAGRAMADAGLVVAPSITTESCEMVEYESYGKKKTRYDAVLEFDMLIADADGNAVTQHWISRGTDYVTPDKALYKAITSGHKYFLMKLFNVGVGNEDGEHEAEPTAGSDPRGATSPQAQAKRKRPAKNGDLKPPMPTESQFKRMHALGKEVYADKWDSKRAELAEAISAKRSDGPTVSSSKELYASEVHYMIERMEALKETEAA